MPTESFPIAPTALSVPLRSYGMLAYHPEISDLRSRSEIAVLAEFALDVGRRSSSCSLKTLDPNFKFEI
jgi:hypothetical protein